MDRRVPPWAVTALLGWAMLVAAAWLTYGRTELSLDEGYTRLEATLPFQELAGLIARRELNGSLHTLLLWALHLGDASPAVMRVTSSVLATLAAAVLLLALRRFGETAALVGVAVVFLNPDVMHNVVDARGYVLAMLLVSSALWLLMRTEATGSSMTAAGFGLVAGLALYAHFFTAPPLGVALLWLVLARRPPARVSLWAALPFAALAAPVVLFFLSGGPEQGQLPHGPDLGTRDYVSVALRTVAGGAEGNRVLQLVTVVVLAALLARGAVGRERSWWLLGVGATSVLGLVAVVASQSEPSIFSARYLSVALPFLGLAVAASVGPLSSRRQAWPALGLVVVVLVSSSLALWRVASTPWEVRYSWTAAGHGIAAQDPGARLTTMVPFEGIVARHVMLRAEPSLRFDPSAPRSAAAFLQQSRYGEKRCLARNIEWVLTTMSPRLDTSLPLALECAGLDVAEELRFGTVRAFRLVPVG